MHLSPKQWKKAPRVGAFFAYTPPNPLSIGLLTVFRQCQIVSWFLSLSQVIVGNGAGIFLAFVRVWVTRDYSQSNTSLLMSARSEIGTGANKFQ